VFVLTGINLICFAVSHHVHCLLNLTEFSRGIIVNRISRSMKICQEIQDDA
jgi:hypothetical protein